VSSTSATMSASSSCPAAGMKSGTRSNGSDQELAPAWHARVTSQTGHEHDAVRDERGECASVARGAGIARGHRAPSRLALVRHFLHDANPPYMQEEMDRYVEAWSQPGAAAGMINYYRASVRQSQKEAAAKLRPLSASRWSSRASPTSWTSLTQPRRRAQPRPRGAPARRVALGASRRGEHVNQLLIDFAPAAV
jgi:hypothetical protein